MLAPRDDELPLSTMTHLSSFQTLMTSTSHEDSSSIEEPYVRDAHHGHVDPQIQVEIYDVQTVDPTLTYQCEEIESPLLGTPLVEQGMETYSLRGHFQDKPTVMRVHSSLVRCDVPSPRLGQQGVT
jgi:hypothetical protein